MTTAAPMENSTFYFTNSITTNQKTTTSLGPEITSRQQNFPSSFNQPEDSFTNLTGYTDSLRTDPIIKSGKWQIQRSTPLIQTKTIF